MANDKQETLYGKEKILIGLTLGYREPKNAEERKLLADIEKQRKEGIIVEIPNEIT